MTSYTKIIDSDLASGALYDKVNDMADALNAGKLEKTSFGLRKASTSYLSNAVVACEYHSDLLLKCTTAGTTGVGALDTSGALVSGDTISDGTVVWTAVTNGTVRSVNGVVPDNSGDTHITIESGWTLLDHKWVDHILNDIRWLRADTFSWQDGSVYASAYSALVNDISGVNSTTETIGSYTITYYLGNSGRKIVLPAMEDTIANIYAESGVAWYYILDTTNQRFKLPRTKFGFTGVRDAVGKYVEESMPSLVALVGYNGAGGQFRQKSVPYTYTATEYQSDTSGVATTSTSYGTQVDILNDIPIQQRSTQMYLYFYAGNYTQSAVEQTAGLNSELFNDKMDRNMANMDPSTTVKQTLISLLVPDMTTATLITSPYTVTKTGWVFFTGASNDNGYYLAIDDVEICRNAGSPGSWVDSVHAQVLVGVGQEITFSGTCKFAECVGG